MAQDDQPVGTVQATVCPERDLLAAEAAWVIGSSSQGQGYAREAAAVMVAWLRGQGVQLVIAHVHLRHRASQGVARAVGLEPTLTLVDGEVLWQG